MLVLTRRLNEKVVMTGGITIAIAALDGVKVRLAIEAPPDVRILREELLALGASLGGIVPTENALPTNGH